MDNNHGGSKKSPEIRGVEVERPRLQHLVESLDSRTLLIVAPPGYGKTTFLRQWIGSRAVCYAVQPEARDVAALARGVVRAFAGTAAQASRYVDELLKAVPHPGRIPDELAGAVLQSLDAVPRETTFAVDDYHRISGSHAAERFVEILHESELFHLVIASRSRPVWATARRAMYGEIAEIGADDLRLTPEEIEEILQSRTAAPEVIAQARGWPAVIALIAASGSISVEPREAIDSVLYSFFAEELFRGASPSVQKALIEGAVRRDGRIVADEHVKVPDTVAAGAAQTGLVHREGANLLLHPLAQSFLLEKIRSEGDLEPVTHALNDAVEREDWDHVFLLVQTFRLTGEVENVLALSFRTLLNAGRVSTLDSFAHLAASDFGIVSPVLELIQADLAFRGGRLHAARALAASALDQLPDGDPLCCHAAIVAGTAAFLAFDLDDAELLFRRAVEIASDRSDVVEALWGLCQTSFFLERATMTELAAKITALAKTPEERVRASMARLQVARCHGFRNVDRDAAASALLPHVSNPRVRTAFGNVCGYVRVLQGHYEEAAAIAKRALEDAEHYQLTFSYPHLRVTYAAASLGLRQFSLTDSLLRSVEESTDARNDLHNALNTRALRARLLLAQHRFTEALDAVAPSWSAAPAMTYGEYISTRALALAAAGDDGRALAEASLAVSHTGAVEVRAAAFAAEAVAHLGDSGASAAAERLFRFSLQTDVWDPLIVAVRACPPLLERLARDPGKQEGLAGVLERSQDESLARGCGLPLLPRYGRMMPLSRREHEVLDLIGQGFTNREIAKLLFIQESTTKVHVRHILDKLNVRRRAEAVARYAEMTDASRRSGAETVDSPSPSAS